VPEVKCSVCGKAVKASPFQAKFFEQAAKQGTPFVCSGECSKKVPDRSGARSVSL
jgi:hypothetical protein